MCSAAEDAVYSSWEEDKQYGIKTSQWTVVGDMLVRYESVPGAGVYYAVNQQVGTNP